jgi:aldehyde:ferredoxin oxidoreductase
MDEVEIQGLDVMSAGVALAWATEAMERGLVSTADTDGLELAWGRHEAYAEALRRIVSQPTDLFRALARGVDHAAANYGGEDFALAFGGNEMAGYHTGPAGHVGDLVGARHSHLDGAGYGLDQKALTEGKPLTPEGIAKGLLEEERWRQVLASLVVCFFARGVYTPEVIGRALEVAGFPGVDLGRLGTDTLARKHAFKVREGFDPAGLRIPRRILETASPHGLIDEGFMRLAIEAFYAALAPGAPPA